MHECDGQTDGHRMAAQAVLMHSIAWQKLYHLNKTPLAQSDLHQLQAQRLEVPGIKFYAIIPRRNACCKNTVYC